MSSSDQVTAQLHPMEILQSLHTSIPTLHGEKLMEWFKRPSLALPVFDIRSFNDGVFSDEYLFAEIMSKYTDLPINVDRKRVAIESFQEREKTNLHVNRRFSNLYLSCHYEPSLRRILNRHKVYMRRVLGDVRRCVRDIPTVAYFGPGTNIGVPFSRSSLYDKINLQELTCTEELAPFALSIMNENDFLARAILGSEGPVSLLEPPIKTVVGAKLAFVPKNAKTDRSITVEPALNSFIQNGIGVYLRRLLQARTTLRLTDQRKNQIVASKAVKEGLATVDLKDASNSLTSGLVEMSLSLCPGWFHLLDIARSKRYTCSSIDKSRSFEFQLFAGMGNGFTFPLESLIFYSLTRAVAQEYRDSVPFVDPVVYGDDIIVSSALYERLIDVFDHVGLVINASKTYADGAFRESCGKHYWHSTDCTPFYIRRPPDGDAWYYTVHNAIWRWACRDGSTFDSRVLPVLLQIRRLCVGSAVHPELGDVGYFPLFSIRSKTGMRTWTTRSCRAKKFTYKGSKGYWCALHQSLSAVGQESQPGGTFTRRGQEESIQTPNGPRLKIRKQCVLYSDYDFPYVMV